MNGIWGKTELPALRYKTDVKEVSYLVSQRPSPRQIACFPAIDLTSGVTIDDEDQRRQHIDYQVAVTKQRASERGQNRH